ncbi:uncharacterized protein LOC107730558, partial [Sinocyclocheilus rhinocerous]|uniref:uncharacterized protein LOC107730558 n=1 Tax=Sinocyclocheilus rhinocerous TaxID=307959 RepID=UPI0007B9BB99
FLLCCQEPFSWSLCFIFILKVWRVSLWTLKPAKITRFFHQNYEIGQYAVAINVPKTQCENGFIPSTFPDFLKEDKNVNVKNIISADERPVYEGKELIAAGVQKTPNTAHSEFLLMNPPDNSPLTNLLNKRKDGCVGFLHLKLSLYEHLSVGSTRLQEGLINEKHTRGIKAFVFKNIWKQDQNRQDELREKLKVIASRIPLYRCKSNKCTYGNAGEFNKT